MRLTLLGNCSPYSSGSEQLPLSSNLTLRNATVSDADAITNIILAAFHDTPHWKYGYQYMDKYPREHHDCMYNQIHQALRLTDVYAQVALLPNITEPHEAVPIATALWALGPLGRTKAKDARSISLFSMMMQTMCLHRDLNMTRLIDFDRQVKDAQDRYLDSVYARQDQLYLGMLATHPDYQRHGAGAALVNAGISMGKHTYEGENVTATLIATEAGEPLYMHLGWRSMHNFTVRSLDVINGTREEWRFDIMSHAL